MADPWAAAGFTDTPPAAAPQAVQADPWAAAGFGDQPPPQQADTEGETFLDKYLPGWRKAKADVAGKTWGETLWNTSPGQLAQALKSAAILPHQMMTGEVQPGSPEELAGARNMALLTVPTAGRFATAAEGPAIARARGLGIPETPAADLTSGQISRATGEALGAAPPRGLTSDIPAVQSATAKFQQIPWVGQLISGRMAKTAEAAAGKVQDIVTELGGTDRAAADVTARRGIGNVIEANNQRIDDAYDALRAHIDPNQTFDMPNTRAALDAVKQDRAAAGWTNPGQGLEQAQNLVDNGGGFNGVHRLRRDLREAGNPASPNPGYNAGDFRRITGAVNSDLKNIVRGASSDPNTAESLFNSAEISAQQLIKQNSELQRLQGAKGGGAISSILNATKEKGGSLPMISALRRSMNPDDFAQISGTLLNEMGKGANGFSLSKFATEWNKTTSAGARNVMFSPEHQQWLNNIATLGQHVKGVDQYVNHSNTAGALMLFEMMKSAAEGAAAVGTGLVRPVAALGSVLAAGVAATPAWYLSRPATAGAMSKWVTAYRAAALGVPSPARIAQLKIATQNLANNLGIDPNQAWNTVTANAPTRQTSREPTSTQPLRITVHKQPSPQGQAKDQSRMVPAGTR